MSARRCPRWRRQRLRRLMRLDGFETAMQAVARAGQAATIAFASMEAAAERVRTAFTPGQHPFLELLEMAERRARRRSLADPAPSMVIRDELITWAKSQPSPLFSIDPDLVVVDEYRTFMKDQIVQICKGEVLTDDPAILAICDQVNARVQDNLEKMERQALLGPGTPPQE